MKQRTARWLLGMALPMAVLIGGYGPLLLYRGELPARLASHFDLEGVPDGSMTLTGFTLATGFMVAVGILLCQAIAITRRASHGFLHPLLGYLGGFIASLGAAIAAWTFLGHRGLENWQEASAPGWQVLSLAGMSTAIGAVAAYLASQRPVTPKQTPAFEATPPMNLGSDERVVWNGTLHNRWFLGLGLVCIGMVGPIAIMANWLFALIPLFVGLIALAFSGLTTRVDRFGLHVGYGLLPWPSTHIPLEEIVTASAIDVRPMEWGGWGYRGSLTLVKRAAVVLRAGPGLRLDLHGGKVFVVTIDDPETPAALLNAETQRLARE